jgi:hypothetical protein
MKQTWWSRRAIGLHAVIIVIIPTFAGLCVWQIHRALDGNQLSWAYVFEWPFFAGYAIYMWWRFLHEAPAAGRDVGAKTNGAAKAGRSPEGTPPAPDAGLETESPDSEAAERDAYNDYLSQLATRGKRKQWR